jgi:hypothetical protein
MFDDDDDDDDFAAFQVTNLDDFDTDPVGHAVEPAADSQTNSQPSPLVENPTHVDTASSL